jgi:D-alanine-D-alanine ligase
VTLDKDCAKRLVQSAGVKTPNWITVDLGFRVQGSGFRAPRVDAGESESLKGKLEAARLRFPLLVKPAYEGSSKGIRTKSLVESLRELGPVVSELCGNYHQPALVEEFIEGDEVTVGVVCNDPPQVLGIMRVVPVEPSGRFVYSLDVKRDWKRLVRYEAPAQLPASWIAKLEEAALACYHVLGCRDAGRVDFRLRDGEPYFLEINPLPGLHPENSDLVIMARGYGVSHAELVHMIFRAACARQHLATGAENGQALHLKSDIGNRQSEIGNRRGCTVKDS